ncbi:MAG: DNA gyrase inhibitor YacG [Pseudomonadota bacterium]
MADKFTVVACPTCGQDVEWRPEHRWRPFCCERCKLIDLGEWATERYKVPVTEQDAFDDLDSRG